MDEKNHDALMSEATTKLGEMHAMILKSAHIMDSKRWVEVGSEGFHTLEWTDFGNQVGQDEINWWVTENETDVGELLEQSKQALRVAQRLKKDSEKLPSNSLHSYEHLLEVLKDFADAHKAEIETLWNYVAWLRKRGEMVPRILFTYRVWGSTRMADRELNLDWTKEGVTPEELTILSEIVLGLRSGGRLVYESESLELGFEIYESMGEDQVAMGEEIAIPEDRLLSRTAYRALDNCATYFAEVRDSLRNIILDAEEFLSQRKLFESDAFWRDFIGKASSAKTTETQLWDFKETLTVWHVKDDGERRKAKVTLAEDVASFANSTGGVLVVGVSDRREIVGIGEGRNLENRLKVARDVIAEYIEYERDLTSFRQVVLEVKGQGKICLVIVVSQACLPVGASDGQGRYSYPVRRETGIERVSRDAVPIWDLHLKSDNRRFLESLQKFAKESSSDERA